MKKEVQEQIDIQDRYESLILKQGAMLQTLATLSMRLAKKSRAKEAKKVKEFITKYGIDHDTK
jgi:hypothetical protein